MNPGKELDELVATKVMGWTLGYDEYVSEKTESWFDNKFLMRVELFKPSTDISDAWKVLNHLDRNHWRFRIISALDISSDRFFYSLKLDKAAEMEVVADFYSLDKFPEAICLAALKSVETSESIIAEHKTPKKGILIHYDLTLDKACGRVYLDCVPLRKPPS